MARPRIIQLDQGKVSLQDFPAETSTALVEHIKDFFKVKPAITDSPIIVGEKINLQPVKTDTLQDVALAVKIDKQNLKVVLVEVKYNVETKEAAVVSTEDFDNAREASVKFKVKAAALNFV